MSAITHLFAGVPVSDLDARPNAAQAGAIAFAEPPDAASAPVAAR
jgi:hypothetical protein